MAKFEVTPELAYTIRSARAQKKITAKSVAEHIGKSPSYFSKLEKGEIKTIEEAELSAILRYIYGNDNASFDDIISNIYSTLELQYENEEIEKQLWLYNYDTVLRSIPVPDSLIEDICSRMAAIGLPIRELCQRINSNEGISSELRNDDRYQYNEWQAKVSNHRIDFLFIRMHISEQGITEILNGTTTCSNYITMLSICYYLKKAEEYGSVVDIPEADANRLTDEAKEYLNRFHFFSIVERNKLFRLAKSAEEKELLLSSFDKENQAIVTKILSAFRFFSDLDIQKSNQALSAFSQNLDWDMSFMMALIKMNYFELNDLSHSRKAQLLVEIRDLLNKYKSMPERQKAIDSYDFI